MKYIAHAISISLIVLASSIFFVRLFYPAVSIFSTEEIGINDIWYFNFPFKYVLSGNLHMGTLPLWTNHIGGGFPIFAEGQVGTFYWYNVIAFTALSPIVAFNLGYIVMFMTNGIGMYLVARRNYRISSPVSLGIALTYTFSGFFVTHISHYALLQTACMFPWVFLAADMLLTNKILPAFVLFSIVLSQQIFAGFPQMVFISLIGVGFYAAYLAVTKQTTARNLLYLAGATVVGFLLSAVQLLPTYELMKISQRSGGAGLSEITYYKFPLAHLATFLHPFVYGNPQDGTYPHFKDFDGSLFWENTGYIGLLPIVGIVLFLLRRKKSNLGLFLCVLACVSFLFMLGGSGPLHVVLTTPPFSYFRFPSRYLMLLVFSLVLLSGLGVDYILTHVKKRFVRLILAIIFICVSTGNLFFVWWSYHPVIPWKTFSTLPAVAVNNPDMFSGGRYYAFKPNVRLYQEFAKMTNLRDYADLKNDLAVNINLVYQIPSIQSYTALYPKRLGHYLSYFESTYTPEVTGSAVLDDVTMKLLRFRSTRYILSPVELTNTELRFVDTLSFGENGNNAVSLYTYPKATPRFWFPTSFIVVKTLEEVHRYFTSSSFDAVDAVLVETDPLLEASSFKHATIPPRVIDSIDTREVVEITADEDRILVRSVTFYPGWNAYIDGNKTTVFPVNLVNQGILVPKGTHRVEFRFEPASFTRGVAISIATFGILGIVAVLWMIHKGIMKE